MLGQGRHPSGTHMTGFSGARTRGRNPDESDAVEGKFRDNSTRTELSKGDSEAVEGGRPPSRVGVVPTALAMFRKLFLEHPSSNACEFGGSLNPARRRVTAGEALPAPALPHARLRETL